MDNVKLKKIDLKKKKKKIIQGSGLENSKQNDFIFQTRLIIIFKLKVFIS
jgi:hypothetical protein